MLLEGPSLTMNERSGKSLNLIITLKNPQVVLKLRSAGRTDEVIWQTLLYENDFVKEGVAIEVKQTVILVKTPDFVYLNRTNIWEGLDWTKSLNQLISGETVVLDWCGSTVNRKLANLP